MQSGTYVKLREVNLDVLPIGQVADAVVVTREGGRIGLVNWTPEGLIGRMFKILGAYMPPPPPGASPPPKWGSEEHVRSLFAGFDVSFERGVNPFRFAAAMTAAAPARS